MTVALVDYGMGNRRSVEKALEHVGARSRAPPTRRDRRGGRDRGARRRRVPRGDAPAAALGLDDLIRERADAGVPVLGICLGMQLLFESSVEHEGADGLGLLAGTVTRLEAPGLKIPHIGWNAVSFARPSRADRGARRRRGLLPRALVRLPPAEEADVVGRGEYGERFVSIVERGNVMGVQFHPEKSSLDGLALLRNFVGVRVHA